MQSAHSPHAIADTTAATSHEDLELQDMNSSAANNPEAPLLDRRDETPRSPPPRYSDQFGNGDASNNNDSRRALGHVPATASVGSEGWFIWALTCSAGISGLLFGYDTGVISSTLVSIGTDLSGRALTTLDKSLITSCTSLFALIVSPFAGVLGDKLGRKPIILIADVLFIAGAIWQAASSSVWSMIAGRSLIGLGVGAASLITPLYISELSPPDIRGRVVTILSLFVTGGQVVAYTIGWLLSNSHAGWRWMVGLGALPAIIQLSILLFLPETPRWLVRADKQHEARRVVHRIYGSSNPRIPDQLVRDIERELVAEENATDDLLKTLNQETPTNRWLRLPRSWAALFQIAGNRRALTIACMLQGLQQLCGFNSLMYFSATIFSLLAFSSPTLTSLSVAVTNFLFTLLAFSLIDRIGRRRILLSSIPVMTTALLLCALAFSIFDPAAARDGTTPQEQRGEPGSALAPLSPLLILTSLTIYTAAYASGIGTIPWQQSELFPLGVRSLGSALATGTNWGANFVVGLSFLPMMDWISAQWTFVMYAVICAVGWVFIWMIYPEMSGLGLEDVRGLLVDGWGVEESVEGFRRRRRTERGRREGDCS
ncbi:MFS transporter, SP family, solute carrier family 2 (myo-inositol transporter), member 13 [Blastomyces parvus]|uniref:MFS transporter, SP family, solute carrier family 2 (Myo-inositol transporter), member 13 n=1 Tax=Blastomyces parvus TaxID=2060905 RepID=A0A2B7WP01_9EURO|nr:MFS transporter, SP family, solute carrier family 2 (myo-inositol transporter), member 13 [Blastomyces parvus]